MKRFIFLLLAVFLVAGCAGTKKMSPREAGRYAAEGEYESGYTGAQVDAGIARALGPQTTVGDPGSDSNLASEQAIREALDLKEDSTSNDIDPDRLAGDTTDDDEIDQDIIEGFGPSADPQWLAEDSTASAVGTFDIIADSLTATYDSMTRFYVDDSAGEDTLYLTIDGSAEQITATKPIVATGFTIGAAAILEAELEILDGATLGTSDINIIDGISDSGSLTAAELLYVDGVTSAIQTQIDSKEDTLSNEAGLYSALSDVSQFYEAGDTLQTNSGTSLPGTCTTGELFVDTDADTNGSLYHCVATDTWKEVDDDGAAGGAPSDADYLVGTANASLSAEIVVGTSPGGELGGTWASPTIDDSITVDGWTLTGATVSGSTGTFTGTLSGEMGVTLDTAATVDLSTASNARGAMRINNDNDVIDYTLPPAEAGLNICFYSQYAAVVTIDPDDGADTITLDGTALTAGNAIDSPGTAGDFICMIAIDATNWLTLGRSGTWVDGGAD